MGILNSAIPQKKLGKYRNTAKNKKRLPNTATLQNRVKRDVIPKPLHTYIYTYNNY